MNGYQKITFLMPQYTLEISDLSKEENDKKKISPLLNSLCRISLEGGECQPATYSEQTA